MSINLKDFFVKVGIKLDDSSFKKTESFFNRVSGGLLNIASYAKSAFNTLEGYALNTVARISPINRLSQALGVSTDKAQELAYAAQRSGVSINDFTKATVLLGAKLGQTDLNSKGAIRSFSALGVKTKDAKGNLRSTSDVLVDVAEKFTTMKDGTEKTAAITGLFGKKGVALLPFLNKGADGIKKFSQEAEDLGIVISKDTIAASQKLKGDLAELDATTQGIKTTIGADLIPVVQQVVSAFLELYKANQKTIRSGLHAALYLLSKIGLLILWIFKQLAKVGAFVAANWKYLAVVLGSYLVASLALLISEFVALEAASLATGLALLKAGFQAVVSWLAAAAPVVILTLLFTALFLIAQDIYYWLTGQDSLIGRLYDSWSGFIDEFLKRPSDQRPWWLNAILDAVEAVKALIKALEYVYNKAKEVSNFVGDKIGWVGQQAVAVQDYLGIETDASKFAKMVQQHNIQQQSALQPSQIAAANQFFTTAKTSGIVAAAQGTPPTTAQQQKQFNIVINNAVSGVDPKTFATKLTDVLTDYFNGENRKLGESVPK